MNQTTLPKSGLTCAARLLRTGRELIKRSALLLALAGACQLIAHAQFAEVNWAPAGVATQSSTATGGEPEHANDGNTDGFFDNGSVTLNAEAEDPGWWEVDLGATRPIGRLKVWFRTLTATEC